MAGDKWEGNASNHMNQTIKSALEDARTPDRVIGLNKQKSNCDGGL